MKTFKPLTGETRPDIWNLQQLIGDPDWVNKLQGIRSGKVAIPATTAAGVALFPAAGLAQTQDAVAGSTAAGGVGRLVDAATRGPTGNGEPARRGPEWRSL